MARHARKKSSTQTYHVVIKGADRQLLFEESKDYIKYLDILEFYKDQLKFEIYAYCLMSNHVHLLLRHPNTVSLESIFRHINTTYACWFNAKYDRTGFVQDGRYYSEPVESDNALLTIVRYIHYNPSKAGLENFPGSGYQWSSFNDYTRKTAGLTDTALVLRYAQIIDDTVGNTLVSASTLQKDVKAELEKTNNVEAAAYLGTVIAKKALEKGITTVVFDRGGFIYHGKIKALADAAREAGLNF